MRLRKLLREDERETDRVQDGEKRGKWDQTRTRDYSSFCILFEVHAHRLQHHIDLVLLLC